MSEWRFCIQNALSLAIELQSDGLGYAYQIGPVQRKGISNVPDTWVLQSSTELDDHDGQVGQVISGVIVAYDYSPWQPSIATLALGVVGDGNVHP